MKPHCATPQQITKVWWDSQELDADGNQVTSINMTIVKWSQLDQRGCEQQRWDFHERCEEDQEAGAVLQSAVLSILYL